MEVVLTFTFKTILSRKATLIIFKSKSARSNISLVFYEHKIAKSVDYNLQVKTSNIWNWQKISKFTNWKFYADAE